MKVIQLHDTPKLSQNQKSELKEYRKKVVQLLEQIPKTVFEPYLLKWPFWAQKPKATPELGQKQEF